MLIFNRSLIAAAGGNLRPGEKLKTYFADLSEKTGIDIHSLWKAWRGQYISRKTKRLLEIEAQERAKANDDDFIARMEAWIEFWETTDPEFYQPHIRIYRDAVAIARELSEARRHVAVELGSFDGAEDEEDG